MVAAHDRPGLGAPAPGSHFLENLLLRHQLAVLTRPTRVRRRARLGAWDKLVWLLTCRFCAQWREHPDGGRLWPLTQRDLAQGVVGGCPSAVKTTRALVRRPSRPL